MRSIKDYWDDWIKSIQESNDEGYHKKIEELRSYVKSLEIDIEKLDKQLDEEIKDNTELEEDLVELQNQMEALQREIIEEEALETYWNNKRPKTNRKYAARASFNGKTNIKVDPRMFFVNDNSIPSFKSGTNDEKALNSFTWVKNRIRYTTDTDQFKQTEVWLFPFETMKLSKGDCEDGAILLANIMLKSGIPSFRIRLNAGSVQGGGHCYVTYLRESDNEWYILDWCYWPNESKDFGKKWKDAKKYFGIWFSFNKQYIFEDDTLDK